jgi:hypothetical protein
MWARNAEVVTDSSKDVSLEVNTEKTNYMLPSLGHNSGQNRVINMANISFENVTGFTYLGEVKRRLNSSYEC